MSDESLLAEDSRSPNPPLVQGTSLGREAWKRLKKNRMAMFGLVVTVVFLLVAVFQPILPLFPYDKMVLDHQDLPPSLFKTAGQLWVEKTQASLFRTAQAAGRSSLNAVETAKLEAVKAQAASDPLHQRVYLLGTDSQGRDMLARVINGGQISMAIGLVGSATSILIGIVIGAIGGYFGGRIDGFIMRFIEIMYGLPYMLLVVILMAIFGNNIVNLFIALSMVSWLTEAQVVRGQIITLKNSEFVEAARSMGASTPRIIFRHLIPNTLGIIIVFATLRIPTFIMMEAFLSYLGLGVSAPQASWGTLVKDGVGSMTDKPWELMVPALAMTLFLFSMNFLGDGLRDAFDPQSKNR